MLTKSPVDSPQAGFFDIANQLDPKPSARPGP